MIGSLPTGSTAVVMTTAPVAGLIGTEPRVTLPLVTVTVPVAPTGKVAVMVTELPKVLGLGADVTAKIGVALMTVWVRLAVAVLLFVSPL